jgi:hypothetical protein
MKHAVLGLLLVCGGCSLYFGDSTAPPPDDHGYPPPPLPPPPYPYPDAATPVPDAPTPPCDHPPGPPDPTTCSGAEVQVFAIYENGGAHGTAGVSDVKIDRPGVYRLALSSYEATDWRVSLAPGASVEAVFLFGYHAQTVNLPGVPVTTHSYDQDGTFACGYSYPYNGQGCDTDQLLARVEAEVGPLHAFHGCYRASRWALHGDASVTSNCDTAAGYEQDDFTSTTCKPPRDWSPGSFTTVDPATCTGEQFVRYDAHYGAWVGAILCGSPEEYKLYMSLKRDAAFLQLADFAGHGQDHCELVNPGFTLPDEDNIRSGGCATCALGDLIDVIGTPVFARARFGEPFTRVTSRVWADLTTDVYACGVAIP